MSKEYLYRYNYTTYDSNTKLYYHKYEIVKHTPCGWWIHDWSYNKKRWVSKTSHKKYAYPTKEAAFKSFKLRKSLETKYLRQRLEYLKEIFRQISNKSATIETIEEQKSFYEILELEFKGDI